MKQQEIQYLALDEHQATVVATLRDVRGAARVGVTPSIFGRQLPSRVRKCEALPPPGA
jgi:hypothetical protein